MRNHVVVLATLLVALRLGAQDTRIDHVGANWPRIRSSCASHLAPGMPSLGDQLRALQKTRPNDPGDPTWRAVGCLEALQYVQDATESSHPPREHAFNAMTAFTTFLSRHPGDSIAAGALAALSFDLYDGSLLPYVLGYRQQIADAMYAAIRGGVRIPVVFRACVHFELATGDATSTRYCADRALAFGADSSWQFLRHSWLASVRRDTINAGRLVDLAVLTAHDRASLGEVAWYAEQVIGVDRAQRGKLGAAWSGMGDRERVTLLHDRVASATPRQGLAERAAEAAPDAVTAFARAVVRAELRPDFLGELFRLCPVWMEQNGYHFALPSAGCNWRSGDPGKPIGLQAQLFRLWEPKSGSPLGLITFVVDRNDVQIETAGAAHVATLDFNLRQFDFPTTSWADTTITGRRLGADVPNGTRLIGSYLVTTPVTGPSSWSLIVRQPGRYGRVTFDGNRPLDTMRLALSDLVPGVASQGLTWPFGEDTVSLSPLGTVLLREPMQVFYQIRNTGSRVDLHTAVILRLIVGDQIKAEPALTLKFTTTAPPGITGVEKEIVLARLLPGNYQLEVQLVDDRGTVIAARATNVYLR